MYTFIDIGGGSGKSHGTGKVGYTVRVTGGKIDMIAVGTNYAGGWEDVSSPEKLYETLTRIKSQYPEDIDKLLPYIC